MKQGIYIVQKFFITNQYFLQLELGIYQIILHMYSFN